MRPSALLVAIAAIPAALAYPGMAKTLMEVKLEARKDANSRTNNNSSSISTSSNAPRLLGDLVHLPVSQLSGTGKVVRGILEGTTNPQSDETYSNVPALDNYQKCRADPCCVWKYIAQDMEQLMRDSDGTCNKWARKAIRMGFHDAGTWSLDTEARELPGGADGSLLLPEELARPGNAGMDEMAPFYYAWYDEYHTRRGYNVVTMADLLQLAANVAVVVCPLGPRTRTFMGRADGNIPNQDGLIPTPFLSATETIQIFLDKTIEPLDLVALLGAHTTSTQSFVDETRAGSPLDSTPGVWDMSYYTEFQAPSAREGVFRLQSDVNLVADPTTGPIYDDFSGSQNQQRWNRDYARAYVRLSLLGVSNINSMNECTKVLPTAKTGGSRDGSSRSGHRRPSYGEKDEGYA